ncbi:MAG: hypothetical protein D6741_02065, partial [Planctomycetota bacterium]
MTEHVIRLRRPWQRLRLPTVGAWRRVFHRPTGLEPSEQVRLQLMRLDGCGTIWLNGKPLGRWGADEDAWEQEVTARLEPENALLLVMTSDQKASPSGKTSSSDPNVFLQSLGLSAEKASAELVDMYARLDQLAAALAASPVSDSGGLYSWLQVDEEPAD